jgi:hypothetical protein
MGFIDFNESLDQKFIIKVIIIINITYFNYKFIIMVNMVAEFLITIN